jgi:hypothetical protein
MGLTPIIRILVLVLSVTQATSYIDDHSQNTYSTNGIILWTDPDCKGIIASTIFDDSTLGKNVSNPCIARSFRLRRPLYDQEQLDISILGNSNSWNQQSDEELGDDLSCTSFIQSYFPINGSGGCYNTPPFTCHRLWINNGLLSNLKGPVVPSSSFASSSPFPLITPSSCHKTASTSLDTPKSPTIAQVPPTPLTRELSSQQHSSQVHTVRVSGNSTTPFSPMYLEKTNVGDIIKFHSKTPFRLMKSTSVSHCQPGPIGSDKSYYNITDSKPVWFYNCPVADENCDCDQDKHFALNSGDLLKPVTDIVSRIFGALSTTTVPTSTNNDVMVTVTVTVHTTMPPSIDDV